MGLTGSAMMPTCEMKMEPDTLLFKVYYLYYE